METTCLAFLLLLVPLSPPSGLERGDQAFARMQYPLAEALYDSILRTSADSADVLWRLARVSVCLADVAPENEKLDLYRRAAVFAERCIRTDSSRSEGHTWRAAALGNIAVLEGGRVKVALCRAVEQALFRGIALNPADDVAYSILGSFYMALGSVSWPERQLAVVLFGALPEGGYDEAESALRKAVALAPRVIRHHFELGELYRQQGRNREALEEFRRVAALPNLLGSDERTRQSAAGWISALEEK